MKIKKQMKRMGKAIIDLKQHNEAIIKQSALVVDNGYCWIGQLASGVAAFKEYFPKADLSVLTSFERKASLEKEFSGLGFISPSERLWPRRYRIVLQMLMLRKKKYDFVVLTSLDMTPLIAALFFFDAKVVLYNQWGQWWSLRFRRISETFKSTYDRRRAGFSVKGLLKKIGLFFIIVQRKDEDLFRHSVLVVDNGYTSFDHLLSVIGRTKECLSGARISILGSEERKRLKDKYSDIEIIYPRKVLFKKYLVARNMFRLRKNKYDYIILLSLDITPIIVSMLFMKGRVILFNRWQQWWSFKPRSIGGYLKVIPLFILNIIIFIYLLISVSWIFLRRSFNISRFNLLKGGH